VLILGGSGLVGSGVRRRWEGALALDFDAPGHAELDVLDAEAMSAYLRASQADVVLNLAAWADVDGAEPERGETSGRVYRLNVAHPERLATLCGELHKHLVHISTDYVFDGIVDHRPYVEDDGPNPQCWYAQTKQLGEQRVRQMNPSACVARIEMPFTGLDHPKRDLARLAASRLGAGQTIQGVTDQRITPVFLDDAVEAMRRLIDARYSGVVHVAASDWTTPYDFVSRIARQLRLERDLIRPATFEEFAPTRPARRPQHSWLDVARFTRLFGDGILRPVEDELAAWTQQFQAMPSHV
jgi:dTDP-4-dehydrorhamnose reductase